MAKYLYILMRNDMASLNAGKAVAQGTHAANQCIFEARASGNEALNAAIDEWEGETQKGFGTCIVLSADQGSMRETVSIAKTYGYHTGICHDPSYPLRDGLTTHLIPLDTCAYVFGEKETIGWLLADFPLMP